MPNKEGSFRETERQRVMCPSSLITEPQTVEYEYTTLVQLCTYLSFLIKINKDNSITHKKQGGGDKIEL